MNRSPRHVVSFDGLRGLGALCVLCTHYALHLFQDAPGYPSVAGTMIAVDHTPLHVIFVGYPWLNMFFVLSGFALSAMVSGPGNTPRTYLPYAINRVFRIYPAYFFVVLATFLLQHFLYKGPISAFGDWFNSCWTTPPTRKDLLDHAIMIGRFKTNRFVFVIWSLVHEMRISLLFPLLYAVVARLGVRGNLYVGIGLLALDFTWATLADNDYLSPNNYYFTLHYMLFFWAGSVIFRFRGALKQWWGERPNGQIAILGVVGFILFTYGDSVDKFLTPDAMRTVVIADWLSGPGVVLLIIFALYSAPLSGFLSTQTMRFFGAISYSLYLLHGVVLIAALQAFYGVVPLGILLPSCVAVSVLLSFMSLTIVEKPFMSFGKRIASSVARKMTRS
ncbi:MAG TPA: acyltransferase [Kofleriaceae bacterium]